MSSVRSNIFKVLGASFSKVIPIYRDAVLFCSYEGMYNDNPKEISISLHETAPEIPIYWAASEQSNEVFPPYVHTVRFGSFRHWLMASFARVTVDTSLGSRIGYSAPKGAAAAALRIFTAKRKKQLCISTWHGTPLKKIAKDFQRFWKGGDKENTVLHCCTDYILAGNCYTRDKLISATDNLIPVRMYGTPRNDVLFRKGVDINEIKKRLRLPLDKKIVLFAPTWRFSVERSGMDQLKTVDIPGLLQRLAEKFGGAFCLAFRGHPLVLREIKKRGLPKESAVAVFDGSVGDDMAEYLLCADVLITDYSSSFYDFALTGKPCFLYAPDLEQYIADQGFYVDYNSLPFPKAFTPEQLLDCVSEFDGETYKKDLNTFIDGLGNIEDGKATERVVNDIVQFFRTHKKEPYITENGKN